MRVYQNDKPVSVAKVAHNLTRQRNLTTHVKIVAAPGLREDHFHRLGNALSQKNCKLDVLSFEEFDHHTDLLIPLLFQFLSSSAKCKELHVGKLVFPDDKLADLFFRQLVEKQVQSLKVFLPRVEDWICLVHILPSATALIKLHTRIYNGYNPEPFFRFVSKSSLVELNIQGSYLFNPGSLDLARYLPQSHITRLNLQGCKIGCGGGVTLVPALAKVTELDLSFNPLRDDVIVSLAHSLGPLTKLVVSWCQFGDTGAVALAEALPSSQLLDLNLFDNAVSDLGVYALADALPHCKLHTLLLSHSGRSNTVAARVLSKAMRNPTCYLETIRLGSNRVDEVDDGEEEDEEDEEEEEDDEYEAAIDLVHNTMHYMAVARNLLVLASCRRVPRIAKRAVALRRLPQEILRLISRMLV
ncbi:hypothetical protein BASA81_003144 [Batrachochytrium salamandrivorans]|nr:hypothetical protein BASA81_003144 [Batrachochytrium salamandrivorans]